MSTSRLPRPSGRLSDPSLGILLVVISAAGFGTSALFVQPLYAAGMSALVVLFWRFFSAAAVSWLYLLRSRRSRRTLRILSGRRIAVLLFLGALYVANSYTYLAALEVVPIALSSIITYIYPAIVAVMATRLVRGLEGRRAWLALGMSMLGVALAVGGIPEGDLPPLWGLLLAVSSPIIYAVWIVLQARLVGDRPRRRGPRQDGASGPSASPNGLDIPPGDAEASASIPDPAPAAALMTTATAAVFGLLALGSSRSISPLDVPDEVWWALLGLGLVATAVPIQAFYAGVRRIGGARAALVSTVEPVYTIVLAMLLFGERLTPVQVVGGALVIGGVILAETGRGGGRAESAAGTDDRVAVDRLADTSGGTGEARLDGSAPDTAGAG